MGKAFVVLTGLTVLGAGSAGALKFGLGRVAEEIQQSPGFAAGWAQAAHHPALLEVVGQPQLAPFSLKEFVTRKQRWNFTAVTNETMETSGQDVRAIRTEHNEIDVPIRGDKGTAQLIIEADERTGTGWKVTKLQAEVPGRGMPLDLLASAPPR
jgi:hypothetical protein